VILAYPIDIHIYIYIYVYIDAYIDTSDMPWMKCDWDRKHFAY
jgi:hypothetical protein